jgi:NAD(P)-dependent dehydrogenase (short-subunit alcohol dehydrogenase family)
MAPFSNNPNVKGLILDVTNEEQVRAAFATVDGENPEEGLYALVNNAGRKHEQAWADESDSALKRTYIL